MPKYNSGWLRAILGGAPLLTLALVLALAAAGCRDDVERSEVDRYVDRFAGLNVTEQVDTLRTLAGVPGAESVLAAFHLGNLFYGMAADSADAQGWNRPATKALLDSAQVYLELTVARDSTFVQALVNLGSLWDDRANTMSAEYSRDDALNRAEEYYLTALAQAPNDEKASCNLGSLYLRQRRTSEAVARFQGVLDHNPRSSLAHYNLAIVFAESKIYREAIREWELASRYDPDGDIGQRSRDNIEIVKQLQEQSENPRPNP